MSPFKLNSHCEQSGTANSAVSKLSVQNSQNSSPPRAVLRFCRGSCHGVFHSSAGIHPKVLRYNSRNSICIGGENDLTLYVEETSYRSSGSSWRYLLLSWQSPMYHPSISSSKCSSCTRNSRTCSSCTGAVLYILTFLKAQEV